MLYTLNSNTQEEETDKSLWGMGQSGLHSKFYVSQCYRMITVSKQQTKINK